MVVIARQGMADGRSSCVRVGEQISAKYYEFESPLLKLAEM